MNERQSNFSDISDHYSKSERTKNLFEAISSAGLSIHNLQPDDLRSIDEFHVRGRDATVELAALAGLDMSKHVLDIGSGIGGPSRFLTVNYGCRVTGIDLTEEYCKLAKFLAGKFGLGERLKYHCASALAMPFDDGSFDVAWTQHVAMNIKEKEKLYQESVRCLKPGGLFVIYDILAGKNQPIHIPVPWAKDHTMSFLATSAEMKSYLKSAGMKIIHSEDKTQAAIEWIRKRKERADKEAPSVLGFQLLLGSDFEMKLQNVYRNLVENRIEVVQFIAEK